MGDPKDNVDIGPMVSLEARESTSTGLKIN